MKSIVLAPLLARLRVATVILALVVPAGNASAVSQVLPPTISLRVTNSIGAWGYTARVNADSYQVSARIDLASGYPFPGDLYVGIIRPGGKEVFTWVDDGGTPRLQPGLTPLLKGIDLRTAGSLELNQLYSQPLKHAFKPDDPLGMYLVFLVISVDGKPLSAGTGWYGAEMQPLFVEPALVIPALGQ